MKRLLRFCHKKILPISLLVMCMPVLCPAQVQSFYVPPHLTDSAYFTAQDSHFVLINPTFRLNKLVVFLGGTKSRTDAYGALLPYMANLGLDVISLQYLNKTPVASLAESQDSLAFDYYRQEICFGTPFSGEVTVDTLNSILMRLQKLLQYLSQFQVAHNWGQYLGPGDTLRWESFLLAGHSQGAGHAAYLAKSFGVERVLMFSGPNDYSTFFNQSANWLSQMGLTPLDRHIAYLSLQDEAVPFAYQYANLSALGLVQLTDSFYADAAHPPYQQARVLYTRQAPGLVLLHHNVPVKRTALNDSVWRYMLMGAITTHYDSENLPRPNIRVYPNPTSGKLHLELPPDQSLKVARMFNISGQLMAEFQNDSSWDLSMLVPGLYLLHLETHTQVFYQKIQVRP